MRDSTHQQIDFFLMIAFCSCSCRVAGSLSASIDNSVLPDVIMDRHQLSLHDHLLVDTRNCQSGVAIISAWFNTAVFFVCLVLQALHIYRVLDCHFRRKTSTRSLWILVGVCAVRTLGANCHEHRTAKCLVHRCERTAEIVEGSMIRKF